MLRRISTLMLITLVLSSCSLYRIDSEEVTSNIYAPKKSPDDVAYLEEVNRPYDVVGFVTVNTERVQDMDEVIAKMKKEAAILGGDAITNIHTDATKAWKKMPPQKLFKNGYVRANVTCTVIAFQ